MINQRIPIPLNGKDRLVAMAFVIRDWVVLLPPDECLNSIWSVLGRGGVDFAGVSEQEVERRSGDGTFSSVGFELVGLTLAAIGANRLAKVCEIEVGCIATEAVALGLTGEQMVQIAFHRLTFLEP